MDHSELPALMTKAVKAQFVAEPMNRLSLDIAGLPTEDLARLIMIVEAAYVQMPLAMPVQQDPIVQANFPIAQTVFVPKDKPAIPATMLPIVLIPQTLPEIVTAESVTCAAESSSPNKI